MTQQFLNLVFGAFYFDLDVACCRVAYVSFEREGFCQPGRKGPIVYTLHPAVHERVKMYHIRHAISDQISSMIGRYYDPAVAIRRTPLSYLSF